MNKLFFFLFLLLLYPSQLHAAEVKVELFYSFFDLAPPLNLDEVISDIDSSRYEKQHLQHEQTTVELNYLIKEGLHSNQISELSVLDSLLEIELNNHGLTIQRLEGAYHDSLQNILQFEYEFLKSLDNILEMQKHRYVLLNNISQSVPDFTDTSNIKSLLNDVSLKIEELETQIHLAVEYDNMGDVESLMHPLFNFLFITSPNNELSVRFRSYDDTMVLAPFNSSVLEIGEDYIIFDVGMNILVRYDSLKEIVVRPDELVYQYQLVGYSTNAGLLYSVYIDGVQVNAHLLPMESRIPYRMAGG